MALVSLAIVAGLFLPFMNGRAVARSSFRHYLLLVACVIDGVVLFGLVRDLVLGVWELPRRLLEMSILGVSLTIGYFAARYIPPVRRSR